MRDLASIAAALGLLANQQESEAISNLRRASGIEDVPNTPANMYNSDYFSYGREASPADVLQLYRDGGTVQGYASGGKIPVSALQKASAYDVPHRGSHFVEGAGGGQDDLIPARLADGEYVFDADIVAALGDGSSQEGARRLDAMREAIRKHKRSASVKNIPPKAKSPLQYFKEASK